DLYLTLCQELVAPGHFTTDDAEISEFCRLVDRYPERIAHRCSCVNFHFFYSKEKTLKLRIPAPDFPETLLGGNRLGDDLRIGSIVEISLRRDKRHITPYRHL